jgi:hypothetical protein
MVPLPEVELSFVLAAQRHLVPGLRPVFAERLASGLAAHADPGPGTVNTVLRMVWADLWVPLPEPELRAPRWARDAPRYEKVSRRAMAAEAVEQA